MPKIMIEIKCGENDCGGCAFLFKDPSTGTYSDAVYRCKVFGFEKINTLTIRGKTKFMRLAECLNAEREEGQNAKV